VSEAAIRRATDTDLAALAVLRRESAREQDRERGAPVSGDPALDDPGFEQRFAAWLARESPHRIIWVAEAGGRLVGAMNLTVFERMPRPGRPPARWGYLGNAFVLAAHRDQGVGSQILAALLGHAREHGFVRVVLSPTERAIPFYQRAGFGPADELLVWRP
jgi:GNAT superfamily N-acetyltransferase